MSQMKTTPTILLLFLVLRTVQGSAQDFETLHPFAPNDTTFVVAVPSVQFQLTYPLLDSISSSPRLYTPCGILSLLLACGSEKTVIAEFATRRAISAYADSFHASPARKDPGDEEYPPETAEQFDHWRGIIGRQTKGDYLDCYLSSFGQLYGIKTYFSELTGYVTEVTTYFDTLQFSLKVYPSADKWGNMVNKFVFEELGLRYTDESSDMAHRLVFLRLRQDALRILNRIRLNKI